MASTSFDIISPVSSNGELILNILRDCLLSVEENWIHQTDYECLQKNLACDRSFITLITTQTTQCFSIFLRFIFQAHWTVKRELDLNYAVVERLFDLRLAQLGIFEKPMYLQQSRSGD